MVAFLQGAQVADFGTVLAHAPYTMNMCSDKERTRTFAREVFADDLRGWRRYPVRCITFTPAPMWGRGRITGLPISPGR